MATTKTANKAGVAQRKDNVRLEATLDILEAQINGARRELAAGGKVTAEGQKFHEDLQSLTASKAWQSLCW